MSGVHGLEHIQGLGAAAFAHHDAVRSHAEAVFHKITNSDFAFAFDIGRTAFQGYHMGLA